MENKLSGTVCEIGDKGCAGSSFFAFQHIAGIYSVTFQSFQQAFSKVIFSYAADDGSLTTQTGSGINADCGRSAGERTAKRMRS